jgi:hypothetical protein
MVSDDHAELQRKLATLIATIGRLYEEKNHLCYQVKLLQRGLFLLLLGILLMGVLLWAAQARAAPLQVGLYSAEGAITDPLLSPYTHSHGLSLEGQEYPFTGVFRYGEQGNGFLSGQAGPYYVHLSLSSFTSAPPLGSPKLELLPTAYPPVLPGEWGYFQEVTLFLTSATGEQEYTRYGPAFQLGEGANGKNALAGLSGWFGDGEHMSGDMNVTLSAVPELSSLWLWLAGGIGLLVGRILRLLHG